MRALAILALAAGACTFYESSGAFDGEAAPGCFEDTDCVLAGSTCCDCPTYAVPVGSGWAETCDNVDCPAPGGSCPALEARCVESACVATCGITACDLSCPGGFVADAAGCLACACAPTNAPAQCQLDTDCVQTRADCCGCARGGADTAVAVAELDSFEAGLGCPDDATTVACPEVVTCDAALTARCVGGVCQLASGNLTPPDQPAGACGRPDLPPCPPGTRCVLNQDSEANPLGVGVCVAGKR